MAVCPFKDLRFSKFPDRFNECNGELVLIKDCQKTDKDGYSESCLILLRSGYLNQYDESDTWYVCEKHRRTFGLAFAQELKQKVCLYPNHDGKQN